MQPTTPSHTDKDSSAESSDISNATPPNLRHVRTRGGRVRQATGRKIRNRVGGRGHVWGGGTAGRYGGRGVGWDSPKRTKRQFPFTSILGAHIQPDDLISPLSILKTFLSDQLIDNIADFTNRYAELMMKDPDIQAHMNIKQRSLFHLWRDTNRDEMWLYICICLLMGIIHKPVIHAYWSRQQILSTPIFSRLMRRDRFKQLRKIIHFADSLNEDPDDELRKLRFFLEFLHSKFEENYTLEEHLAIDEYLSLWKGRLKFRIYIPSKKERYGIKIFVMRE